MRNKYDVPFDPDFPANDTAHMYAPDVVDEVLERIKALCSGFEHTPTGEPRDDKAPRVYSGEEEEEDDLPDIQPGELLIAFGTDKSVKKFYFRPLEPIMVPPGGGSFMRIVCGATVRDAADAARSIYKAVHARAPRRAAGGAAAATEPAAGDAAAADDAAAKRETQLSEWHAAVVRLAREQSVTSPIYAGACAVLCAQCHCLLCLCAHHPPLTRRVPFWRWQLGSTSRPS